MNNHNEEPATSIQELTTEEAVYVSGGIVGTGTGIYSSGSGTGGTLADDDGTGHTDDHGSGTGIA